MAAADGCYPVFLEAKIEVALPAILGLTLIHLNRGPNPRLASRGLVLCGENDTMNTETEFIRKCQSGSLGEFPGPAHQFVAEAHERSQPHKQRSFHGRPHGAARQRA